MGHESHHPMSSYRLYCYFFLFKLHAFTRLRRVVTAHLLAYAQSHFHVSKNYLPLPLSTKYATASNPAIANIASKPGAGVGVGDDVGVGIEAGAGAEGVDVGVRTEVVIGMEGCGGVDIEVGDSKDS